MATIAQDAQNNEDRVRIVAYISRPIDRAVEIAAARLDIDKREFIERALKAALERN